MTDLITLESALKSELQAIAAKLNEFRQRLEALEAAAAVQPPADGDPDKIAAAILKQAENSHKKAAERDGLTLAIAHFETLQSQKTEALEELQAKIQRVNWEAERDRALAIAREKAAIINDLSDRLNAELEALAIAIAPGETANGQLNLLTPSDEAWKCLPFTIWQCKTLPKIEFRSDKPDLYCLMAVRSIAIKQKPVEPEPDQADDQDTEEPAAA